jgi:prevent-host-death family protein
MHKTFINTTVNATQLQRETGSVLRRVAKDQEHITVEHNGFPIAVILSLRDYATLLQDHQRMNVVVTSARDENSKNSKQ